MGKKSKTKASKQQPDDFDSIIAEHSKLVDSNPTMNNAANTKLKPSSNNKKKHKINKNYATYPNVSICTPTFNRRPFFKGLIECVKSQDYPHYKIEWIIVDDGTDCVSDIFEDPEFIESMGQIKVRYFYEKEKMDLGKKRNFMHEKCKYTNTRDIIVYMDDDDFYPPDRVSHSVDKLMKHPKALCAGSSEIYLWFNTLDKMYKFGPYGPNHATAGTFAFRRELLNQTGYEDSAVLAEEKHFLKNYTVPFVQLDPLKTILVFSHEQNTFDKRRLINDKNKFCSLSPLVVSKFIKNKSLESFYKEEIGELLKSYEAGDVKNKPKVLDEIQRRDNERAKQMTNRPSGVFYTDEGTGNRRELQLNEVIELIQQLKQNNQSLVTEMHKLKEENTELKSKVQVLMEKMNDQLKSDIKSGNDEK